MCDTLCVHVYRSGRERRKLRKRARQLAREHNRKIIERRQQERDTAAAVANSQTN